MRTSSAISAILVAAFLALCACGSFGGVASFWKGYRNDLIVAQKSDQGPWGGHRWIQWRSAEDGRFTVADTTRFAETHGWKFVATQRYTRAEVATWVIGQEAVFPLVFENQGMTTNIGCERFPRAIDGGLTVIRFDSGWVRVPPGTGKDETAFGFVLVADDGRQMGVYHAWGDI